jgi:hypothetical protein
MDGHNYTVVQMVVTDDVTMLETCSKYLLGSKNIFQWCMSKFRKMAKRSELRSARLSLSVDLSPPKCFKDAKNQTDRLEAYGIP